MIKFNYLRKISSLTSLVFIVFCGVPQEETIDANIDLSKVVELEIIYILQNSPEDDDLPYNFKIIILDEKNPTEITLIKNESVLLGENFYGLAKNFVFLIDDWEVDNICFSPVINNFINENVESRKIYIKYNNSNESVKIYGDTVKDIQISIPELIVDNNEYWIKNDSSLPNICR